ncbi:MAG TPA: hypothetical protein VFP10_10720, partial [Candidatus Eisenbacteria bacterium]|nr:hypothetical protein [Candidatus Eisenbacteria bacterium]
VMLLALFSTSTRAQRADSYPDIVHAYRSLDPDAVGPRWRVDRRSLLDDLRPRGNTCGGEDGASAGEELPA